MGFLSRSNAAKQRNNNDQHEQLAELRRRARRRLVGALVIVLLVVVLVPILLKSDGADEVEQVVQVFPPIVAPSADSAGSFDGQQGHSVQGTVMTEPDQATDADSTQDPTPTAEQADHADDGHEGAEIPSAVEPLPDIAIQTEAQQAAQQSQQAQAAQSSTDRQQAASTSSDSSSTSTASEPERTDDGSLAMAVLEGRVPVESQSSSGASAAAQGGFIVQVAAYSSREGANERQQQLHRAGVNNAFVQAGEGGSGTTYRLRVGPFENRQAAEAALTRLRSLGYDDSFIRAQ